MITRQEAGTHETLLTTTCRILVVDDEPKIAQIVQAYLERQGYHVVVAGDGQHAMSLVQRVRPDLIILDVMLPEMSGWDVCRQVRRDQRTADIPIIMLTARDDIADRIVGLELGADDYVVKPFDPRELVARVRAVLRRAVDRGQASTATASNRVLRLGDLCIDLERYEVHVRENLLALTRSEFQILAALATQPGRVFSRLQLLDAAQGEAFEGYERTIDTHVKNLRRKLEDDPRHPRYLVTVYGIGYKLAGA